MELNLCINEINIQPGANIDSGVLKDSQFQKVGLVQRFVQKLSRHQVLYVTENCTVECFDGKLSLYPCTHSYLNKDRQWQTKASILLCDGQIQKVDFHILDGVYAAPNFIETFRTLCNENFGQPTIVQPNQLQWKNQLLSLSSFLHSDSINADFAIEILE